MIEAAEWHRWIEETVERRDVDDDVVERLQRRRAGELVVRSGPDQHLLADDALGGQQRAQQRRVVLAVAEPAREDRRAVVGDVTPVAEIDGDVADVARYPLEQRLGLRAHVRLAWGDLVGEGRDLRRDG